VCLTDGREYLIPDQGLVFGRDASSDVVIDSDQVSRRHASIQPTATGFVVNDESANGTLVNGQRISMPRVLARADIIRIGGDEFRFYADFKPVETVAPPPLAVGARQRLNDTLHGIPKAPPPSMSLPALNDTLHGFPATPAPGSVAAIPPLASLLIRSGALKGRRLHVRASQATIGRADSCDIVLPESSVSTLHAKAAAARGHLGHQRPGLHQRHARRWRAGARRGTVVARSVHQAGRSHGAVRARRLGGRLGRIGAAVGHARSRPPVPASRWAARRRSGRYRSSPSWCS
jgi:pSer/pThr/pTyr-binding forkhead associated (FHA) protein